MSFSISADRFFDGGQWQTGTISISNGVIESIGSTTTPDKHYAGCFIAPAFIEIQIYGAHEKLLAVYPEVEALHKLYDYCTSGGATLFLPTVATNTPDVFRQCIDAVRDYWAAGGKGIWGLHLEGPWINAKKRGAHIADFIHSPSLEEVVEMLEYGKDVIKIITLAPEVCSAEVIEVIRSYDITISAGHSNASFEEATMAFNNGIGAATHLYNAMSPLQHRAPGLVGACLLHPTAKASIIADGYHVDFEAIKIAKELMGSRLFVITDAVTETTEGPYQHQLVGGDRYECNGVLSGSAMTMHSSFVNLVKKASVSVEEALRMCSLYPAQVIGADEKFGRIAPQYAAQFVVLNNDLQLVEVITS
jgi:N-acetylglucosamine-6-phosphate deacetylase